MNKVVTGFGRVLLMVLALSGGGTRADAAPIIDPRGVLVDLGTSTWDTKSGRLWLDLTQSTGVSYNQLTDPGGANCSPTCEIGPFAGWTFAQSGDVKALVQDVGLNYGTAIDPGGADQDELRVLIELLGGTVFFETDPHSFVRCEAGCGGVNGILNRTLTAANLVGTQYAGLGMEGYVQQAFIEDMSCCGDWGASDSLVHPDAFRYYASPIAPDAPVVGADSGHTGGAWLYRSIPEPSTWLLVLGAAGAVGAAGRLARCRDGHRGVAGA